MWDSPSLYYSQVPLKPCVWRSERMLWLWTYQFIASVMSALAFSGTDGQSSRSILRLQRLAKLRFAVYPLLVLLIRENTRQREGGGTGALRHHLLSSHSFSRISTLVRVGISTPSTQSLSARSCSVRHHVLALPPACVTQLLCPGLVCPDADAM